MAPVKLAVILAAGVGRRLKSFQDHPKGFIRFGPKTIIEESIDKLIKGGIKKIVIVTGHLSGHYDQLAKKYSGIQTLKNEKYADSGSMYSLYCAKDLISEDFLLLESDLIYESRAITTLQEIVIADCILLSGKTNSNDEVYVSGTKDLIEHLSKKIGEIPHLVGELVGISRISKALYKKMVEESEKVFKTNLNWEYDTGCLSAVAKQTKIGWTRVDDLLWSEVDNEEHMARAREKVYPKILAKV